VRHSRRCRCHDGAVGGRAPAADRPVGQGAWTEPALPLLAALIVVNRQEQLRRRRTGSRTVTGARAIAQGTAFLGLVAGFWHLHWIAGAVVLGSSLVALGVHSAGFTALEPQPSKLDQEDPSGKPQSEDGDGDGS
jgi:hypothetical protein